MKYISIMKELKEMQSWLNGTLRNIAFLILTDANRGDHLLHRSGSNHTLYHLTETSGLRNWTITESHPLVPGTASFTIQGSGLEPECYCILFNLLFRPLNNFSGKILVIEKLMREGYFVAFLLVGDALS